MKKILKTRKLFLILILKGLFFAFYTEAAILYFKSNLNEYHFGDVFLVSLYINTQGERINAAQIEITFPSDKLKIIEFLKEESVFSLWPQEPTVLSDKGKISFIAGIPNGFEGERKILTIAFEVNLNYQEEVIATINFSPNCLVLLNDGLGTKTNLDLKNLPLFLKPNQVEKPKNEFEEFLNRDIHSPFPFEVYLVRTPLLFDGKYFITFFTVDLQSGISHYEIQEGRGEWKKTNYNFYLLEDQTLKNEIKVRAVDKAGNEKVSTLKLS